MVAHRALTQCEDSVERLQRDGIAVDDE